MTMVCYIYGDGVDEGEGYRENPTLDFEGIEKIGFGDSPTGNYRYYITKEGEAYIKEWAPF